MNVPKLHKWSLTDHFNFKLVSDCRMNSVTSDYEISFFPKSPILIINTNNNFIILPCHLIHLSLNNLLTQHLKHNFLENILRKMHRLAKAKCIQLLLYFLGEIIVSYKYFTTCSMARHIIVPKILEILSLGLNALKEAWNLMKDFHRSSVKVMRLGMQRQTRLLNNSKGDFILLHKKGSKKANWPCPYYDCFHYNQI